HFFYFWGQRFWRRCLHSTVEFPIFINSPRSPFSAGQMQLAIENADVEFPVTRIVFIKLSSISKGIRLRMTIQTGLLIWSYHVLLGEVVAAPALGGVDVDILWSTKTVHRVVHLHSFPAMIVVVLIKHEVHIGPTCGEERVVAFVVR